jgi:hypothetical protein
MRFEFNSSEWGKGIKEQLREQIRTRLDEAGLQHVTFHFSDDDEHCVFEGFRDQAEKDKASQAVLGLS